MLVRKNFDGQHVYHNRSKLSQACQNGQSNKAAGQVKTEAYPWAHGAT